MNMGVIVEGHGEVEAVPLLIRRIALLLDPDLHSVTIRAPLRVARGKIVKELELRRALELVARKIEPEAPILVMLDSDDDPACVIAPRLLEWARQSHGNRPISVIAAVHEYEAWFLASAKSLAGHRGLPVNLDSIADPEALRNPKTWLDERMTDGYTETLDQPALTQLMDLDGARRAASFEKLVRDLGRLFERPVPPRRSPVPG